MIQDRTDRKNQAIFNNWRVNFAFAFKRLENRPQVTEATLIKHDVSICAMLSWLLTDQPYCPNPQKRRL